MFYGVCVPIKNRTTYLIKPDECHMFDKLVVIVRSIQYAVEQIYHVARINLKEEHLRWWPDHVVISLVKLKASIKEHLWSVHLDLCSCRIRELLLQHVLINLLNVTFRRYDANGSKVPAETLFDDRLVMLSCWYCCAEVKFANFFEADFVQIVPSSEVQVLSDQLICALISPSVRVWHMDIIDEEDLMILIRGLQHSLIYLDHSLFHEGLQFFTRHGNRGSKQVIASTLNWNVFLVDIVTK